MMRIYLSLFLILFSLTSNSASFDCKKAKSVNELNVCHDPDLSKLDDELFDLYKKVKDKNSDSGTQAETVNAWKYRETHCWDYDCLIKWYNERKIVYLKKLNNIYPTSVTKSELKFNYSPVVVKLKGKVITSYALATNEKPIKFEALKLESPITVIGEDEYSPTISNIHIIQPVIIDNKLRKIWATAQKYDKSVEAVGSIFPQDNGNQLTRVLLEVIELKVIETK